MEESVSRSHAEIKFRDKNNKPKEVLYISLNATDASLK